MGNLETLERAAIGALAEALPKWQQLIGPGLDGTIVAISKLVHEADDAAAAAEAASADDAEARLAVIVAINQRLTAGPEVTPKVISQHAARIESMGQPGADAQTEFDVKTLEPVGHEFEGWYEEFGIGGFVAALGNLVKIYGGYFDPLVANEELEPFEVLLFSSTNLREHFGKDVAELNDLPGVRVA